MKVEILTDAQLAEAKCYAEIFRQSLAAIESETGRAVDVDPLIHRAQVDSVRSVLGEFDGEIARFERERAVGESKPA